MDVYHKPEIFVRRMMYKPESWKNNFLSEKWNQGAQSWEEFNNKYIETTNKLKESQPNIYQPRKTVTIQVFNTAAKEKPQIIHLEPKTENYLNDKNKFYNSFEKFSNSMTKTIPNNCIFKENLNRPISPIEKVKPFPKLNNELRQKFFSGESPPTTPEGEIVQELVLNRFNKMNDSISRSSPEKNGTKEKIVNIKNEDEVLPVVVRVRNYPQLETVFRQSDYMKLTPSLSDSASSLSSLKSELSGNVSGPSRPDSADVSSFNQQKFLDLALGEDLLQSTMNTLNEEVYPNVIVRETHETSFESNMISIGTADVSELISYRGDTIPIRNNLPCKSEISNSPTESNLTVKNDFAHEKRINELMQLAAEQHFHMQQASKAITLCRWTKEFTSSVERLEAERLLLLAVLKNRSILDEINRMDSEEYNESIQQGNLTISNIRVPLTSALTETIQHHLENFTQWYLCIGAYGSQVHASKIVTENSNQELIFDEPMVFTKLPPDFSLELQIYVFELPKNIRSFSHTSRYHLNENSYQCPTPKKLFKKHVIKQAPVNRTILNDNIRNPSFKLAGSIKISLKNLHVNGKRELKQVHCYLEGTIGMNINTNLQIYVKCYGFLTMRSEAGGLPSWNRYWCLLEGHFLKYWNYPAEADIKDPVGVIDLKKCVTSWIDTVSGEICTKPRTLLLETIRRKKPSDESSLMFDCRENYTIIRHLLTCDSDQDLKKWSKQLNLIVSFLRNWNIIEKIE